MQLIENYLSNHKGMLTVVGILIAVISIALRYLL